MVYVLVYDLKKSLWFMASKNRKFSTFSVTMAWFLGLSLGSKINTNNKPMPCSCKCRHRSNNNTVSITGAKESLSK